MPDSRWSLYRKKNCTEMRPYIAREDLSGVSVSEDMTPQPGGMIARDPANHADQWYIYEEFFLLNYEPVEDPDA